MLELVAAILRIFLSLIALSTKELRSFGIAIKDDQTTEI